MNLWTTLTSIYRKDPIEDMCSDMTLNIVLNKWLGLHKDNLRVVRDLIPFMFYVEPFHYFCLLYFSIQERSYSPKVNNYKKVECKENKLLDRVRYVLGWSKRELLLQQKIIDITILKNESYWKKELGIGRSVRTTLRKITK